MAGYGSVWELRKMGKFVRPEDLAKYDELHYQLSNKVQVLISDLNRKVSEGEFDKERAREIFKEQLIKFGREFDRHLLIKHGLTPDNIDKTSFAHVAKTILDINAIPVSDEELGIRTSSTDMITPQEIDAKEVQYIERDVYTDRAFNMLYENKKIKVDGSLNYRTRWVHDVISETLWRWTIANEIVKQTSPLVMINSADELADIFAHLDPARDLPVLYFTDRDFRQIIRRKRLSGEEIADLVKKYSNVKIYGEATCFWNTQKKTYENVKVSGSLFNVSCEASGQATRRNKKTIHKYKVTMNLWGFILYNNMLQHKLTGFENVFYSLKGSHQNLVRYLSQFKVGDYKLSTLINISGFKRDSIYRRKQRARIIAHLTDLKDLGFIKNWSIKERKNQESVFRIIVNQRKSRLKNNT